MKSELTFERLLVEGLFAGSIGTALVAILYSHWWRSCCETAIEPISIVLAPGYIVGWLIGGGPHGAAKYHYYVGVAVEFFLVWIIIRVVGRAITRRKSNGTRVQ